MAWCVISSLKDGQEIQLYGVTVPTSGTRLYATALCWILALLFTCFPHQKMWMALRKYTVLSVVAPRVTQPFHYLRSDSTNKQQHTNKRVLCRKQFSGNAANYSARSNIFVLHVKREPTCSSLWLLVERLWYSVVSHSCHVSVSAFFFVSFTVKYCSGTCLLP